MSTGEAPGGGRIAGLDAARGLLMLGGLLHHGSLWQPDLPLFSAITLVSHSFRMGAFFGISGFLAGIVIARRSANAWLARRLVQIGIPTAFGLLVICPLMTLVLFAFLPAWETPRAIPYDWFHLWFLVALLLYAALARGFDWIDSRTDIFNKMLQRFCTSAAPLTPLLLGVAGISLVLMMLTTPALSAISSSQTWATLSQWRLIAGYAPDYLLGFALARSTACRDRLLADWWSPTVIVGGVAIAYVLWFIVLPPQVILAYPYLGPVLAGIGSALCPPAAFLLILRAAFAVQRVPRLLGQLADASFTMYVLHLPIILAINMVLLRMPWNPYVEYAIAVLGAGTLSYWLHFEVVKRSQTLSLLLNGKVPPRQTSQVLSPAQ